MSTPNPFSSIGSGLSAYQNLRSGTTEGDLRAAANTAKLAGNLTGSSSTTSAGNSALDALNMYSGIKQGGVAGYGGAALGGVNLYDELSGTTPSPWLGGAGSALGLYNALKQGGVQGDTTAALDAAQLYGTVGGAMGAPGAAAVGGVASSVALPLALFAMQYGLFNKEAAAAQDPKEMADVTNRDAEGFTQMAKNQPQFAQADMQAQQAYRNLANEYATGQINPYYDGPPQWQANTTGVPVNMRPSSNPYVHPAARGGMIGEDMNHKERLNRLREVYAGPKFSERQHFDDGGSAYLDYFTPSGSGASYDPVTMPNGGSYDPNTGLVIDSHGNVTDSGQSGTGPINLPDGSSFDPTTGLMIDAHGNVTGGGSTPSSGSSSGSHHTISGDLTNAENNITGQNGIFGILKALGALAPVAGALIRPKTNTNTPSAAPGMTQGATNPQPSTFNRTQVASPLSTLGGSGSGAPTPPAIGAAGSPSNLPGGKPMSLNDWYTYGQRPEASFFNNNAVPLAQATGIASGQAKGGRQSALDQLGGNFGMPEFDSSQQNHVEGPGDGTSDDIPAQLSDGEYVMDANTVSMLGNGSNKAGAQRLDQLRENLRKHAAKPMSKGKQFMKAKPPEAYLSGGKAKEKK